MSKQAQKPRPGRAQGRHSVAAPARDPAALELEPRSAIGRYGPAIITALVVLIVAAIRLRIAGVPLERDEGEYAYAGQLILHGVPPYTLIYNMKFPGAYYAYAAIMAAFGQTPWGIHVGLLIVNAATTIVLFAVGARLIGRRPAAIASIAFAVLSLDRGVLGPFGHATHFVILPALAGLLVLLAARRSVNTLWLVISGALLGVAVLMKQQAIFLPPFALAFMAWRDRISAADARRLWTRLAALVGGMAAPFAIMCALFAWQHTLDRFWFWTFHYAWAYVSEVSLSEAWPAFVVGWNAITAHTLMFWCLGLAGMLPLWLGRWPRETRVFLTGLLAATSLCVCPGFNFRQHYFIVMLPAVALLAGVTIAAVERGLRSVTSHALSTAAAMGIFAVMAGTYAYQERAFLFALNAPDLSVAVYGPNPFVEAQVVGQYLKDHSAPADGVAVLGSEPEILFYAHRTSATGYIYTYPLMEAQSYAPQMQKEMRAEIERAGPQYLVEVPINGSWLVRPNSARDILTWMDQYIQKCYDLAGLVDIKRGAGQSSQILWGTQMDNYAPQSKNVMLTFHKKSTAPCVVD